MIWDKIKTFKIFSWIFQDQAILLLDLLISYKELTNNLSN